jgi:hypothetical protein
MFGLQITPSRDDSALFSLGKKMEDRVLMLNFELNFDKFLPERQ